MPRYYIHHNGDVVDNVVGPQSGTFGLGWGILPDLDTAMAWCRDVAVEALEILEPSRPEDVLDPDGPPEKRVPVFLYELAGVQCDRCSGDGEGDRGLSCPDCEGVGRLDRLVGWAMWSEDGLYFQAAP